MRNILPITAILTLLSTSLAGAADSVHPAQAFRAKGQPVAPAPDGTIFCEAEEFRVEKPGWQALPWGENYYAATFANTFLSRKAFLGAPAECEETVATIRVGVKETGKYLVLVRYEAPYRFETQFKVKIEQAGATKLDRLYGARDNLKIWAFGEKLKKEVAWPWGAVENVVWEGHDAYAELQPGVAKISLIAGKQPGPPAKRNVDLVMLTRDEEQVKHRIENERYLPLDGWLTQSADAWMKVHNPNPTNITVTAAPVQEHSPYWVHIRNWKPIQIEVAPGQTTDWLDAGGLWDALNDAQWVVKATGPARFEFGVTGADGKIATVRELAGSELTLIVPADMRYSRTLRTQEEGVRDLVAYLKKQPKHGKVPSQTLIYAYSSIAEFPELYGLTEHVTFTNKTYVDWRGQTAAQLEETCQKLTPEQRQAIRVVSLGDEIGLPAPDPAAAAEGFAVFLQSKGGPAGLTYNTDPARKQTDPTGYYWSMRYLHHYGIREMKKLTDALRKHLPNAHIGANYSPHHGGSVHSYLGPVFQWVNCFRDDGMTLPWSEDYIWQVPVGSPQMNGINLDLFRAGNRGKPDRKILYYVMPHTPGNTAAMWRRLFHNALGHGMKIVNLFEFHPVWIAYTENHTSFPELFTTVLRTFRELGLYEDIVQAGHVRPAQVGLWFSETGDIWDDNHGSFAAAKRALYTAILHQQVPLDFIVEQDALDGSLAKYNVLYLTDAHVTKAASKKIAEWVENGGVLFATAGAGMFDESNQPNETLRALLGINQTALDEPAEAQIAFIKQDIPFAKELSKVGEMPVLGVRSRVELKGAETQQKFADDAPAVTVRKAGKGQAIYCAFLPSLSYYQPAIPLRPVDRGSTDDAMSHLLPTEFNQKAANLIGQPLAAAGVKPTVSASAPLVETSIIDSDKGTLVVVTNWTSEPRKAMQLTLHFPVTAKKITLASGGKVKVAKQEGRTTLTFDLELADVVILK